MHMGDPEGIDLFESEVGAHADDDFFKLCCGKEAAVEYESFAAVGDDDGEIASLGLVAEFVKVWSDFADEWHWSGRGDGVAFFGFGIEDGITADVCGAEFDKSVGIGFELCCGVADHGAVSGKEPFGLFVTQAFHGLDECVEAFGESVVPFGVKPCGHAGAIVDEITGECGGASAAGEVVGKFTG